ncbi:molybdenum cofactor guanylyltransferase [Paenibacillus massiliensis]|uniref:molybdenum cofactor guanylyltransferase n=1 Tax=Paenibacillus massiliensis TaxID=225917 RepID=UPI0004700CD9|nr:molybdenum cofactor guanylyltransferase [Paenibacillus massiliensis]
MDITGIVLAGGMSSRMGTNKAELLIEGQTVVQRIASEMSAVASRVIISAQDTEAYAYTGLEVVADLHPRQGPLAGLYAGMQASRTEWNLVCACDMPLLHAGVFRALAACIPEQADEEQLLKERPQSYEGAAKPLKAVVPTVNGRLQPLAAIYHISVLPALEACLQQQNLRVQDWLKGMHVYEISSSPTYGWDPKEAEQLFMNMNRPEDYIQVCRLLSQE